jgi:hypothetical protein
MGWSWIAGRVCRWVSRRGVRRIRLARGGSLVSCGTCIRAVLHVCSYKSVVDHDVRGVPFGAPA